MPEELVLEQIVGKGAAVDADERSVLAIAVEVQGLGDQLLAGSALARDQDGALGGRHPVDEVEDPAHLPGAADDALEGVLAVDQRPELGVLTLQAAVLPAKMLTLDRLADDDLEVFELAERLAHVVERPELECVASHRLGALACDQHHGGLGGERHGLAQNAHAVHPRHTVVDEDDVVRLLADGGERLLAVAAQIHAAPEGREDRVERLAYSGIIVHDEDLRVQSRLSRRAVRHQGAPQGSVMKGAKYIAGGRIRTESFRLRSRGSHTRGSLPSAAEERAPRARRPPAWPRRTRGRHPARRRSSSAAGPIAR